MTMIILIIISSSSSSRRRRRSSCSGDINMNRLYALKVSLRDSCYESSMWCFVARGLRRILLLSPPLILLRRLVIEVLHYP